MHPQAYEWVRGYGTGERLAVLDVGGRNVNGTPRDFYPNADPYTVLDAMDDVGVDVVADAATWTPDRAYHVVLCCEVFEHTPVWREICGTAFRALCPGGLFVATMGGPGRPEHSAVDGCGMRPGEHYRNVDPWELEVVLKEAGFTAVDVDYQPSPADTRCAARRPV